MKESSDQERPDIQKQEAARRDFLAIAHARQPIEVPIEKGEHKGEMLRIETKKAGPSAVEYRGFVGHWLIAIMYMNPPIAGVARVTNAKVAKDYWRGGVATKIYSEIASDLRQVNAKLEPQWGVMSPNAVRFWQEFGKDDVQMQARLDVELQQMKESGRLDKYDAEKESDDVAWNGEYTGPDKHPRALAEWEQKGSTHVVFDTDNLVIYPLRHGDKLPKEAHELIPIHGNEERIIGLMEKYE